ncbi:exonuclease subunit SbcD [Chromobacterium sp. IIBBL 290-4]|uniref:exonuclease subunit SbcD n=1 Tax=Chromobacterium sp. IIBBL 290-4 TaxID=2953890 RepID=UPI0020B851C6|nr:exonuclease subunit SbcD [Chromobacterium sp. IIBBL 290-4]UTH73564.1 exonuclease subunit SbcD [Chromobacterium sp. IIBBL 290-4]
MRILHTSDWHLGQHFMGKTRQAEHLALIDWLIRQVGDHAVDAVIIAGDIFDTGSPPSYARELYNRLVVELHTAGCALLILGGNHDSVATLGESRPLLAYLRATVIPAVEENLDQQVRVLNKRDGAPGAIVCAIPFIRPRDVLQSQAGQSAEEKQISLQEAIAQHYQAVYQLARAKRNALRLALPIIATGHLATVGASASESVREIYVGALEAFPTAAFPPADYIALGHIHRPQKVGGQEHIRYCGSPIPLSFDEAEQQKEVLLVDVDDIGLMAVTALPVPRFQQLASIKGDLKELEASIQETAKLASADQPVWLEVMVKGDDYLTDLQTRIQSMTEGLPVEVLRVRRDRGNAVAALQAAAKETLDELTPFDVFNKRLEQEALDEALRGQLDTRYRSIVTSLQEASE